MNRLRNNPWFYAGLGVAALAIALLIGVGTARAAAGTVGPSARPGTTTSQFGPFVRLLPTYVDALVLSANTAVTQVVPAGATWVVFASSCAAFYVTSNGAAAVPGSTTTDGSAPELNPTAYFLQPGVVAFSVIAPTTCKITAAFYKLGT